MASLQPARKQPRLLLRNLPLIVKSDGGLDLNLVPIIRQANIFCATVVSLENIDGFVINLFNFKHREPYQQDICNKLFPFCKILGKNS